MELFEGPPRSLPQRGGSASFGWSALAATPTPIPAPIRHLDGYAPFVAYLRGVGLDPVALRDPMRLGIVLAEHGRGLQDDPAVAHAAGIFLGNVLVASLAGASWFGSAGDPDSARILAGPGDRAAQVEPIRAADHLMAAGPEAASALIAELLAAWTPAPPPRSRPEPVPHPPSGAPYVRPELREPTFLDDDGAPIAYGRRWRFEDGPPDDAYSRVTHPERFAGVHTVADALVAYLAAQYRLRPTDGLALAAGFERTRDDWVRIVRLEPASEDGAPLLIGWTGFPGVVVHAGAAYEAVLPVCGCDACDETAASAADELEQLVLAVAAGGFAESLDGDEYRSSIVAVDGSGSRGSSTPDARLDPAVAARLAALPNGWRPWPERSSAA